MAKVRDTWGGLDVLVNNAGISSRGTIETTDEALWDLTLAVNLKGPGWASRPPCRSCASGRGRSSTSARPGPRGRCRGSFPT